MKFPRREMAGSVCEPGCWIGQFTKQKYPKMAILNLTMHTLHLTEKYPIPFWEMAL